MTEASCDETQLSFSQNYDKGISPSGKILCLKNGGLVIIDIPVVQKSFRYLQMSLEFTNLLFQITNDISAFTFVNMGISIVQIESINDDSKTLTVDLRLKLDWNDTRIQFKTNEEFYLRNNNFIKDCIWTPWNGIFFLNMELVEEQKYAGFRNQWGIIRSENGVSVFA